MHEATPPRNKITITNIATANYQNELGQRQAMDKRKEQPDLWNDSKVS